VEEVIGYLREKSSAWIAQDVERKARNFLGHKLWARGHFAMGRSARMKAAPPTLTTTILRSDVGKRN